MDPDKKPVIYFPGLNGLRFLAAAGVIVCHIEQFKGMYHLPNIHDLAVVTALGQQGVSLFFVLSGFLITYLLLVEQHWSGTIALGKFYRRRALRIWPLYYLVVLGAFLVLPRFASLSQINGLTARNFSGQLLLFLLMLPNLASVLYPGQAVVGASQGWSIGVEEQFYLVWPLLLRRAERRLGLVLGLLIAGKLAAQFVMARIVWGHAGVNREAFGGLLVPAYFFLERLTIEQMAIGGAGALLVFRTRGKSRLLTILYSPIVQVLDLVGLALLYTRGVGINYVGPHVAGVLFIVLILNVACNPRPLLSLENRLWRWLGTISYGLYMYHPTVIWVLMRSLGLTRPHCMGADVLLYVLTFAGTIIVAYLSYEYLESRFLVLKKRIAVVPSGQLEP